MYKHIWNIRNQIDQPSGYQGMASVQTPLAQAPELGTSPILQYGNPYPTDTSRHKYENYSFDYFNVSYNEGLIPGSSSNLVAPK